MVLLAVGKTQSAVKPPLGLLGAPRSPESQPGYDRRGNEAQVNDARHDGTLFTVSRIECTPSNTVFCGRQ